MFLNVKSLSFQAKSTIAVFHYSVYRTNSDSKEGNNKTERGGGRGENTNQT